jgi:alkylation response protein AidB-like acyl-CoA dehydrogenase
MPDFSWTFPTSPNGGSHPAATAAAAKVLQAVRGVVPRLRERAPLAELEAKVPQANIEDLQGTGFFKLMRPEQYGGAEAWFDALFPIVVEMARGCASTAWCVGQTGVNQWMLSCADEQAQRDVWGSNPDALICASYAPAMLAEVVEAGWRLSGRWGWASGCDNASWAFCGAVLRPAHGIEKPTPAYLLVPMSDCKIVDDWDVVGLCGTGSKTLVLEGVVVPKHRILLTPDSLAGTTAAARAHPGSRQCLPMLAVFPSILAAAGIGAALGALGDAIENTRARSPSGTLVRTGKVAEFPAIQARIAEAAAAIDVAQTILMRDLNAVAADVRGGQAITVEQRILCRRNHGFASRLMVDAIGELFEALGAGGLHKTHPVQRAWRDVNAVSRHINLNWDMASQMYGQMVLGLEPRGLF